METQTLNGQKRKIGHLVVKWSLQSNQNFVVCITRQIGTSKKTIKAWEFEQSPISEAISYSWYDYVIRSIEQQYVLGFRTVPEFLLNVSGEDAETLIIMVLEQLG